MSGKDDYPLAAQLHHQVPESDTFAGIETCSRFINHKYPGQVQQGHGNTHALFHSPGKFSYFPVLLFAQVDGLKCMVDYLFPFIFIEYVLQDSDIIQKIICG